jgi:hypothetical protein
MSGAEFIHSALKTGGECGLSGLSGAARKVWLISEAEVLSEMEGIGAFLDAHAKSLPEAADAFASIGAREIAECRDAFTLHRHLPLPVLVDRLDRLTCPEGLQLLARG